MIDVTKITILIKKDYVSMSQYLKRVRDELKSDG